jgi:hypothetical protein
MNRIVDRWSWSALIRAAWMCMPRSLARQQRPVSPCAFVALNNSLDLCTDHARAPIRKK